MNHRSALALTLSFVLLAGVACDSGGGGGAPATSTSATGISGTATPPSGATSTTLDFDPNMLTALVLRTTDVPAGLVPTNAGYGPKGADSASFTVFYAAANYYIESSVARFSNNQDQQFQHTRQGLNSLIGPETNFNAPGTDAAYKYKVNHGAGLISLVTRGPYIITTILDSEDGSAADFVTSEDNLLKYTSIVLARVQQAIDDPTSLSPLPNAPRYENAPIVPGEDTTPPAGSSPAGSTPAPVATP